MVQAPAFYLRSLHIFLILVLVVAIPLGLIDVFTSWKPFENYLVLPIAKLLVELEMSIPLWLVGFAFIMLIVVSIVWLPALPLLLILAIWVLYAGNKLSNNMAVARAVRDAEEGEEGTPSDSNWRSYIARVRAYRPNVLRRNAAPGPRREPATPTPE
jgi:small basic protein